MANYGLLVDAQWCSGCHSCEIACQMEHGLPVGETGVKVVKIGPWAIGPEEDENWQFSYLPIPTKQCDTCAMRRGAGKVPTCVQHCQSQCLEFGTLVVRGALCRFGEGAGEPGLHGRYLFLAVFPSESSGRGWTFSSLPMGSRCVAFRGGRARLFGGRARKEG